MKEDTEQTSKTPDDPQSFVKLQDLPSLTISAHTMRTWVGVLGVGLPIILILGSQFGRFDWQGSLSEYVNTPVGGQIFVGFLTVVGVFLLWYQPYKADKIPTNIAGLAALGVALFPVSTPGARHPDLCGLIDDQLKFSPEWCIDLSVSNIYTTIHGVSAVIFLLALGYISLRLFTKSDQPKDNLPRDKRQRNQIYIISGWVIVACTILFIIVIVYSFTGDIPLRHPSAEPSSGPILWLEAAAIVAFGISWFVKGRSIKRLSDFVAQRNNSALSSMWSNNNESN